LFGYSFQFLFTSLSAFTDITHKISIEKFLYVIMAVILPVTIETKAGETVVNVFSIVVSPVLFGASNFFQRRYWSVVNIPLICS